MIGKPVKDSWRTFGSFILILFVLFLFLIECMGLVKYILRAVTFKSVTTVCVGQALLLG